MYCFLLDLKGQFCPPPPANKKKKKKKNVIRVGSHNNVPGRPSAKVAPVWVPTGAHDTYNSNCHYPAKMWVARQKLSPSLGRQCIWAELHETGGMSATWGVGRRGCCRSANPAGPGSSTASFFSFLLLLCFH